MPSYEFRCNQCNREFVVKISYSEKSSVRCPDCGSGDLKELFGRYHFIAPGVGAPDVEKSSSNGAGSKAAARSGSESGSGCSCGGSCSCAV
ncbi:MAG: zinc ribbon domain-containing protein [Limnochordales bacterium]|nr:zinc ribbon domain-containing protein [Limnochordales bacterium]